MLLPKREVAWPLPLGDANPLVLTANGDVAPPGFKLEPNPKPNLAVLLLLLAEATPPNKDVVFPFGGVSSPEREVLLLLPPPPNKGVEGDTNPLEKPILALEALKGETASPRPLLPKGVA